MDRPGKNNLVADFLSRITRIDESLSVDDAFPDEHLFSISTNVPWFVDLENYLVGGKFLGHMTPKEKQRIVQRSSRFSWIDGYLFYTGLDLVIR